MRRVDPGISFLIPKESDQLFHSPDLFQQQPNARLRRVKVGKTGKPMYVLIDQLVPDEVFPKDFPKEVRQIIFNLLPIDDGEPGLIECEKESDISAISHTCQVFVDHTHLIPQLVWDDESAHPWIAKTLAIIYQIQTLAQLKFTVHRSRYVGCLELECDSNKLNVYDLHFPNLNTIIFRRHTGYEEIILDLLKRHANTLKSVKLWWEDHDSYLNDSIVDVLHSMPHLYHLSLGNIRSDLGELPEEWKEKLQMVTILNVGGIEEWHYLKPLLKVLPKLEALYTGEIHWVIDHEMEVDLPQLRELTIGTILNRPGWGNVVKGLKLTANNLRVIKVKTKVKFVREFYKFCPMGGTIHCYLTSQDIMNQDIIKRQAGVIRSIMKKKIQQAPDENCKAELPNLKVYLPAIRVSEPCRYDPEWMVPIKDNFKHLQRVEVLENHTKFIADD